MNRISLLILILVVATFFACEKKQAVSVDNNQAVSTGLKIAYINSDTVLNNFDTFKDQKTSMEARQKKAEEDLMKKGAAIEKEIMAYQQQAQKGTMTGKEMEAREKYLASRQEAFLAERDQVAQSLMDETNEINKQLRKDVDAILQDIKEKEGYDFILSYIEGGTILVADEKYDITERVIKELNEAAKSGGMKVDTSEAE